MKRAGLDYWHMMHLTVYDNLEDFFQKHPGAHMHYASTKAPRSYAEVAYGPDDFLVFGQETRGLPENLLEKVYDHCIRIPMRTEARSLNLSNSVAIVLYEALRQNQFDHMKLQGQLTKYEW